MVDRAREPEGANFAERWLMPFISDSALWPILVVVLAHATILLGSALILAVRDRSIGAMLALAAISVLTFEGVRQEVRTRRRPGPLTGLATLVWVSGAIAAWAAGRAGLF